MPDPVPPSRAAGWDASYLETPPWDIGRPQAALAALIDAGAVTGRVLDSGCGTGEMTLLAASRGLDVTGVDVAPRAVARARQKAAERGLVVRFDVADMLDPPFADASYQTVLDVGVFHVFDDAERGLYVASIGRVLARGGAYHFLVFSDAEPGDWGPRRISRQEIDAAFAGGGWEVGEVTAAELELTSGAAQGWRVSVRRTA